MKKLVRITTVPISLEKLLEGQLTFMSAHFEVIAMSAEPNRLKRFGEDNQVRVKALPLTRKITPFMDLKAIWKLYRILKAERPEIVHTHTPKAGMVGMIAARLAGVPHRWHTVAGLPLMETTGIKRKILERVERITYAMATRVLPNSKVLHEFILEQGWLPSSKLRVLHNGSSNGIDTDYFSRKTVTEAKQDQLRLELGIKPEDKVFVFVGRLVGDKGINELVQAFEMLSQKYPNIHLILVGPLEIELDPLANSTLVGIESNTRIHSVGYQPDVRPYLAISDVLTFPSYREGFPNVVLQAAAMDLPGIVTDINGCNEIIQEGENGLLIPTKDMAGLKQAMERILMETGLLQQLGKQARERVVERFDRLTFWKLLLKEYQALS